MNKALESVKQQLHSLHTAATLIAVREDAL